MQKGTDVEHNIFFEGGSSDENTSHIQDQSISPMKAKKTKKKKKNGKSSRAGSRVGSEEDENGAAEDRQKYEHQDREKFNEE